MKLETTNISFSYKKHPVLNNVNFSAASGELIAILGPNGAGKSTLFRCILGFLENYSGDIKIDGMNIRNLTRREMAKRIAYIPQSTYPVFNYTVLDTVLMGMTHEINIMSSPDKEMIKRAMEAIESLDLEHLCNSGFSEISGGERQLVLIARSLVQSSDILVMDEPTANLDFGNQCNVMKKISGLSAKGYIVIMSTHNPELAFSYADRAVILNKGSVVADGAPDSVLTEDLIHDIYGVSTQVHDINVGGRYSKVCIPITTEMGDKQ